MKEVDYILTLTDDDKVRIRFTKHRGKIRTFVIQYLARVRVGRGRWRSILRIDNCHGFSHQHTFHLIHKEVKIMLDGDNNTVFTLAKKYVIERFAKIKENFIFAK